jgi:membrane fusion protein (multidrug efflux system)
MSMLRAGVMAALVLAVAGCGGQPGGHGGPPGGMRVNVRATPAALQPVEEKISLVASISANESIEVKSEVDGTVVGIHFEEGQPVKKGQLLVQLDEEKLKASVAEAEANFTLAASNRERSETMLGDRTISKQEYDQATSSYEARRATLELMKRQWRDTRILAPFSGIAGARLVSPGQVISRSTSLTSLVDIHPVKIELRVPERFLGRLLIGQTIEFRVAAYPGETFRGEVYFIDPQVDLTTRTVLVKATHPNDEGRLHPGMFGNLDLILRVKDSAVVIPESALVQQGDQASVYIIDASNLAQQVAVKIGTRLAGQLEVLEGLKGGEQVIYEGLQKIGPGAPVLADAPAGAAK